MILSQLFSEETLFLMDKYGVSLVMLVIVISFLWYMIKNQSKRQSLQDAVMNDILKKLTNKDDDDIKKHKNGIGDYAINTNKVQQLIYLLLNEISADKISVFEFHNGNKSFAGMDFNKCSNTFEAVELGIPSKYKEYQNIPISVNFLWNRLLIDKTSILISDVESLKDKDSTIYTILTSQGIKSYYSRLINDYDGFVIGFITIEYYRVKKILDHEELKRFSDITLQLTGLMKYTKKEIE